MGGGIDDERSAKQARVSRYSKLRASVASAQSARSPFDRMHASDLRAGTRDGNSSKPVAPAHSPHAEPSSPGVVESGSLETAPKAGLTNNTPIPSNSVKTPIDLRLLRSPKDLSRILK
jgi:hypothetical protein